MKNNIATVILLIIFIASSVIFVFVANEDLYSAANSGANVQINNGTNDDNSSEGNGSDEELPSSELDEEDNENLDDEEITNEDEEDNKDNNTTNTPIKKPTTNNGSNSGNSNGSGTNTNTGNNNSNSSNSGSGTTGNGSTGTGSGSTGSGSTGEGSGTTGSGSTGEGSGSTGTDSGSKDPNEGSGSTGDGSGETEDDSNTGSGELTEEEKKNMYSTVATYDSNVVVIQNGTTIDLSGTIVRKTPTSASGSTKYVALKFVAPYELLQSQLNNATLVLSRYDARGNQIISLSYTGIVQGFTTDGLGYFDLNATFSTGDYYILTIDWGDGISKTYRVNINVEVLEA